MWVIKVTFKDGSWYRGVCEKKRATPQTVKKRLLMDFKEIHPAEDRRARGGGLYRIWEDNKNYR